MARIRTIKPEFFTSEDIVGLSPLARLLYIALWCEADKDGRMVWRPKTLKLRYLPADQCDIGSLCAELINAGLVVLYGDAQQYAYIPTFGAHQHINPREATSQLPDPDASTTRHDASTTRHDASTTRSPRVSTRANPDVHAQGGREGKGRVKRVGAQSTRDDASTPASPSAPPAAGKPPDKPPDRGSRLAIDALPDPWRSWLATARPDLDAEATWARFRDHWAAMPGARGRKADWLATWRNWCRNEREPPPKPPPKPAYEKPDWMRNMV